MMAETVGQLHYTSAKPKNDEKAEGKYIPKYVSRLLMQKAPKGKVLFYFKNRKDYIVLFPNGHLNTRGEEDMFKAWGSSEFKDLKPQTIFKELEEEVAKIKFVTTSAGDNRSFDSYGEFISWLINVSYKKQEDHRDKKSWLFLLR